MCAAWWSETASLLGILKVALRDKWVALCTSQTGPSLLASKPRNLAGLLERLNYGRNTRPPTDVVGDCRRRQVLVTVPLNLLHPHVLGFGSASQRPASSMRSLAPAAALKDSLAKFIHGHPAVARQLCEDHRHALIRLRLLGTESASFEALAEGGEQLTARSIALLGCGQLLLEFAERLGVRAGRTWTFRTSTVIPRTTSRAANAIHFPWRRNP